MRTEWIDNEFAEDSKKDGVSSLKYLDPTLLDQIISALHGITDIEAQLIKASLLDGRSSKEALFFTWNSLIQTKTGCSAGLVFLIKIFASEQLVFSRLYGFVRKVEIPISTNNSDRISTITDENSTSFEVKEATISEELTPDGEI